MTLKLAYGVQICPLYLRKLCNRGSASEIDSWGGEYVTRILPEHKALVVLTIKPKLPSQAAYCTHL